MRERNKHSATLPALLRNFDDHESGGWMFPQERSRQVDDRERAQRHDATRHASMSQRSPIHRHTSQIRYEGSRRCNPRRSVRPRRGVPRASRGREKTGSVAPRLSRPPHPRPFSPGNTGGEGRKVSCEQGRPSEFETTKTGDARNAFQTNDWRILISAPGRPPHHRKFARPSRWTGRAHVYPLNPDASSANSRCLSGFPLSMAFLLAT